ncbi:DUF998 domain-containing protein [Streptacidiphilus sp. PB12-B1b]|uniref:DUF998 domain-containing protein n=1 Tax=Streptacidiphilus sp. PB12-B1b TaxID=2705012 RepID=UPI0015F92C37|nr:DUF998 domain-containing protein [Streptacidiphilus sp. PB12-B1b]QMU77780.1 DUF998 domain-containing protein [Streptacidiphilus sp. PB12-B1b]
MRIVPWWALLSAATAPVLLIVGWVVAATLQTQGYDPVHQTISTLASLGATDRWVMTLALFALGACHMVTALGLRAAALTGRITLACGGAASIAVALNPEPPRGPSAQHTAATAVGFSLLAAWPLLAVRLDPATPWPLRPVASLLASAAMFCCAGWFMVEMWDHGPAGTVERILTTGQSIWPLVVAGACALAAARVTRAPG